MGKLKITVWSRGKEVYGYVRPKTDFNATDFMNAHEDDFHELSEDSIANEIAVEIMRIMAHQNNVEVLAQCRLPEGIKCLDTGTRESYRNLLDIKENEVGAVWFHDYVNTLELTWENASDFDISKVCILFSTRVDDTDDTEYPICIGVTYDGEKPDETEAYGEPKSGYFDFTILE